MSIVRPPALCRAQDELLEQRDAQIQGLRTILAQAQGASEEMRRQLDMQAQSLEARRDVCAEQARQLRQLEEQLKARDEELRECRSQLSAANAAQ